MGTLLPFPRKRPSPSCGELKSELKRAREDSLNAVMQLLGAMRKAQHAERQLEEEEAASDDRKLG